MTPAHLLRHAGLVPASTGPQTVGTLDTRPGGYRHKAGRTVVGMVGLLFATPALAQTQAQMNDTARAGYAKADAAMNAQWKTTYAAMKARDTRNTSRGGGFGYAAATLASQRAWLAFRDRQCTIEAGQYNGGTMAPMVRASCLTRLTKERTVQLRDLNWNN